MAIKIDGQDLQGRYIWTDNISKVMLDGGEIRPNTLSPVIYPIQEIVSYDFMDKTIQQINNDWSISGAIISKDNKGVTSDEESVMGYTIPQLSSAYYIEGEVLFYIDEPYGHGRPTISFIVGNDDIGIYSGSYIWTSFCNTEQEYTNITYPGFYKLVFDISFFTRVINIKILKDENEIYSFSNEIWDEIDIRSYNTIGVSVTSTSSIKDVKFYVGNVVPGYYISVTGISSYDTPYGKNYKLTVNANTPFDAITEGEYEPESQVEGIEDKGNNTYEVVVWGSYDIPSGGEIQVKMTSKYNPYLETVYTITVQ